ncbi:MAG: 2-dehydropantoate 2-reductase N-terminal domain-containing protein [Myxococcota bacterium]
MQSEHQPMATHGGERLRTAVVGGGAFGTALAVVLSGAGHQVLLWTRRDDVADAINRRHRHPRRLQELQLPPRLRATTDLHAALAEAQLVVSALPMTALRSVWARAAAHLMPGSVIVSTTKGIETETLLLPTQVIQQTLRSAVDAGRDAINRVSTPVESAHPRSLRVACLSGPSFAAELAQGLPAAVTVAADAVETARFVQRGMSTNRLRCYACGDVLGTELAGALKNVIAIASGVAAGLQLGHNAQAALVSRGVGGDHALGGAPWRGSHDIRGIGGSGRFDAHLRGGVVAQSSSGPAPGARSSA